MKNKRNDFNQMDVQQLELQVEELRRELFKIRLDAATSHVKSFPSEQRRLKKSVAHALTVLRQKLPNAVKA